MPKYAELPTFRKQNYITEADGAMLHREARALALRRIEESARTEDDFQKVIEWWDKLDENRERRERDHETGRSTALWNGAQMNCTYPIDRLMIWF